MIFWILFLSIVSAEPLPLPLHWFAHPDVRHPGVINGVMRPRPLNTEERRPVQLRRMLLEARGHDMDYRLLLAGPHAEFERRRLPRLDLFSRPEPGRLDVHLTAAWEYGDQYVFRFQHPEGQLLVTIFKKSRGGATMFVENRDAEDDVGKVCLGFFEVDTTRIHLPAVLQSPFGSERLMVQAGALTPGFVSTHMELSQVRLRPDDANRFYQIAGAETPDQMLEALHWHYPTVHVVALKISPDFPAAKSKLLSDYEYRDPRVPPAAAASYQRLVNSRTVGFYIEAATKLAGGDRPLQDVPVILLVDKTSRPAILHEIVHHLVALGRTDPEPLPASLSAIERQIHALEHGSGEELDIFEFLKTNRIRLFLSDQDLASWVPYALEKLLEYRAGVLNLMELFRQHESVEDPAAAAKLQDLATQWRERLRGWIHRPVAEVVVADLKCEVLLAPPPTN